MAAMDVETIELCSKVFFHPSTIYLCGPSYSGKSTLAKRIIKYKSALFTQDIKKVIYCFGESVGDFDQIPGVETHRGLPEDDIIQSWVASYSHEPWMIIMDDLGRSYCGSNFGVNASQRLSHHRNVTLLVIGHSCFQTSAKSSFSRAVSLNTHYYIFSRSLRDIGVYSCFGRQAIGPEYGKAFVNAFLDCTEGNKDPEKPPYIVVSLHPVTTSRELQVFSSIFPDEFPMVGFRKVENP